MRYLLLLALILTPALATAQARVTGYIVEQTICGVELKDTNPGTTYSLQLSSGYSSNTTVMSTGGDLEIRLYKVPNDGQELRWRTYAAGVVIDDRTLTVADWKDYFGERFRDVATPIVQGMTAQERTFFVAAMKSMVKATIQADVDAELEAYQRDESEITKRRPR